MCRPAAIEELHMASTTDFTDEEWTRLKRAPFVAGMAISLADPGETAVLDSIGEALATPAG
jgi:hypothetical protein